MNRSGLKNWIKEYVSDMLHPYWMVRHNIKGMVLFELMYHLLSFFVFFPVLVFSERLLLWVNLKSNIAAYNAKYIFLNPLTWLVLAALGAALTFLTMLEYMAISDAIHAAYCGIVLTPRQIFSTGLTLAIKQMKLKNYPLLFYCVFVMPFATFFDTSNILKFIKLPGFITESVDKYWYYKMLYYVVMAVLIYFMLRWFYVFIIIAAEDAPDFETAGKKSARMTRGFRKIRILVLYLFWAAVNSLAAVIFSYILAGIAFVLFFWLEAGNVDMVMKLVKNPDAMGTFIVVTGYIVSWFFTPFVITAYQGTYYRQMRLEGEEIKEYTGEEDFLKKYRYIYMAVVAFCVLCTFFSVPSRYRQIKWNLNTNVGLPMIMAHRGYSAAAPENTLEALEAAADIGVQAVEFDVQMTSDGQIVLLHDDSLTRTTGLNRHIWEVTYDDIKDLDASVCFRKEAHKPDYPKTRIPTLDEALKMAKGRLYCNIEIKRTGHDTGIEEKVVEIIRENDFLDECDVTSQDYKTLQAVRAANPDVLTAYTSVIGIGDIENLDAADIISINETFANFREVWRLKNIGKRVFVWTVNSKSDMERLISLNVDAILTNDPALGQEVLKEHQTGLGDIKNRLYEITEGL